MTFPIQYSFAKLSLDADIDQAVFQTAQGWFDTRQWRDGQI